MGGQGERMIRSLIAPVLILGACSAFSAAHASNRLAGCESLNSPFHSLAELVWDSAVGNPPQTQLCHRAANAAKHYAKGHRSKAVDELYKFINETGKSSPKHIDATYAETLIGEATRVISQIDGSTETQAGQVSGGVFEFGSNVPVAQSDIILTFVTDGQEFTTVSDSNGLFSLKGLPPLGVFVITAKDTSGAIGSGQGSILPAELNASVPVFIDFAGAGTIEGTVTPIDLVAEGDAIVNAYFTDSGRQYSTTVGGDGYYRLDGLHTDGTVILIAFDNSTGSTASFSSVLSQNTPSRTVNLQLKMPVTVQPELTNSGFEKGVDGWETQGPAQVVDRNVVFDIAEQ